MFCVWSCSFLHPIMGGVSWADCGNQGGKGGQTQREVWATVSQRWEKPWKLEALGFRLSNQSLLRTGLGLGWGERLKGPHVCDCTHRAWIHLIAPVRTWGLVKAKGTCPRSQSWWLSKEQNLGSRSRNGRSWHTDVRVNSEKKPVSLEYRWWI